MENQNNYINLKYNEKFQVELILANNSILEDIYNKINPLTIVIKNFTFNIHNSINLIYTFITIILICFLKPLINRPLYLNFSKIEYIQKIDYFYVFLPLIMMLLMEVIFNFLIKDRFKPNKDKTASLNDLKNLLISLICKTFLCFLFVKILDNHLHKYNKYANFYLSNNYNEIATESTETKTSKNSKKKVISRNIICPTPRQKQYLNYNWNIINLIYIGAFILNIFLHFFLINIYEEKRNIKYFYIKNQLAEFYKKEGLIENPITLKIYKELFN